MRLWRQLRRNSGKVTWWRSSRTADSMASTKSFHAGSRSYATASVHDGPGQNNSCVDFSGAGGSTGGPGCLSLDVPLRQNQLPLLDSHEDHARRSVANRGTKIGRAEEHTSELQSQSNLVCRLL